MKIQNREQRDIKKWKRGRGRGRDAREKTGGGGVGIIYEGEKEELLKATTESVMHTPIFLLQFLQLIYFFLSECLILSLF